MGSISTGTWHVSSLEGLRCALKALEFCMCMVPQVHNVGHALSLQILAMDLDEADTLSAEEGSGADREDDSYGDDSFINDDEEDEELQGGGDEEDEGSHGDEGGWGPRSSGRRRSCTTAAGAQRAAGARMAGGAPFALAAGSSPAGSLRELHRLRGAKLLSDSREGNGDDELEDSI
jgi:hypothetical protein